MTKLLYQGHGSLRLISDNGVVIYIDPFAGNGYDIAASIILVTHQHLDHRAIQRPAKKSDCVIIQNTEALKKGVYNYFKVKDIQIEAVPAYNKNHAKDKCVGYLVTIDGILCYFAGDTSKTVEMNSLILRRIDYAFLPVDGIFNMGTDEASECAEIIGAIHATPIHMSPGKLFSEKKAAAFSAKNRLIIHPGEEIKLEK